MNMILREELDDFVVNGRGKSEDEFRSMVKEYLKDKTPADKNEIGIVIADLFADRMFLLNEVEYKLGKIRYAKAKAKIKTKELVMC